MHIAYGTSNIEHRASLIEENSEFEYRLSIIQYRCFFLRRLATTSTLRIQQDFHIVAIEDIGVVRVELYPQPPGRLL